MRRMRYDKSGTGWGRGDAVYACDVRTGNCSDFHAYFIALARSIGIPARFAIGATIPADKKEARSKVTIAGLNFSQMAAGYQWTSAKHGKIQSWLITTSVISGESFELTKGRDLVVDPEPASGPINFLVYPCSR